ncbi:MAG: WD40 repeat domain-containing protein [Candidatus Aminicenantes bacterium]|nr:MAG: WD40 repeat domain-containing protein [Candidatus Aminicenantes bacterium]
MKRTLTVIFVSMIFMVQVLQGVVPRKWDTRNFRDFLKGKFEGISVSYEGVLSLSPNEEKIEAPAEEFFLSLLFDQEGVGYLGTGHSGRIYKISKAGQLELYFQVPEMDIYCLAHDRGGNLYAGTSPNGKIWKITPEGKGEIFFNPRERYIWDLLFTERGVLLAAVGESGGIYEITPQGEGRLILKAEENHILCMEKARNGDLIAGSGGKGLLYRIPQGKTASVLFESPYEEIKSITLDREGNIYAAAGGEISKAKKEEKTPVSVRTETEVTVTASSTSADLREAPSLDRSQPSTLFKIGPDGVPKNLWHSNEELIYSLLWQEVERKLIFGTGNKGRIYVVDKDEKVSLLVQKDSEQVYSLLPFDSKIYTLSNNPSNLSILHSDQRFEGEYLSQVLDAKTISTWGKIKWEAQTPTGTILQFQTRSGNSSMPNDAWNAWSPPYQRNTGEQILSPKTRYIQFKIIFKTQSGKVSPQLQKVTLFYLQANIAPVIKKLELLPANEVYLKPPEQKEVIWGLDVDLSEKIEDKDKSKISILAKKAEKKGFQTITWEAADENDDKLLFSLYIRGEAESRWRILKEKWTDKIYAFDTLSFPDGVYFVKLEASDGLSNPEGVELKSEKTSRPMIVDNSLPAIRNFQVTRDGNKLVVTFQAEDILSHIEEVRYLIRPNEWKSIFPIDGICDSMIEDFKVNLTLPPNFDNLITVKVIDSYHNIGVYRKTF